MNFLNTVCAAAIVSALVRLLVPENKFTKQLSLLIAGIFLLVSINAVMGAELSLDTSTLPYEETDEYISFSGNVNEELKNRICAEMSERIKNLLKEKGIEAEEIHIIVNISGLYSISISRVELVFPKERHAEAEKALKILESELSGEIKPVVIEKE